MHACTHTQTHTHAHTHVRTNTYIIWYTFKPTQMLALKLTYTISKLSSNMHGNKFSMYVLFSWFTLDLIFCIALLLLIACHENIGLNKS